jgi:hypothetical protein
VQLSTREEWDRVQARGRTRYLVLAGVVRRGLPMGVLVAFAVEVLTGRPVPDSLLSPRAAQWRLAERRFGGR